MEMSQSFSDYLSKNFWLNNVVSSIDNWSSPLISGATVANVFADVEHLTHIMITINLIDGISQNSAFTVGQSFRSLLESSNCLNVFSLYYNKCRNAVLSPFSIKEDLVEVPSL